MSINESTFNFTFDEFCERFSDFGEFSNFTLNVPNLSFYIVVKDKEVVVNTSGGADIGMSHKEFMKFMNFFNLIGDGVKITH